MMKWKARTETTNIGELELGNLTFNEDYMEVSIDIYGMSDSLTGKIAKAIEIAKVAYTKDRETLSNKQSNTVWSDMPVVMDFTFLRVRLEAGKPIDYSIQIGFHDAVNVHMELWDCSITVDLSEYTTELKKAIIKVLVDRFF